MVQRFRDGLPPWIGLRLRAQKNRFALHGFGAPAGVLSAMVRPGTTAVDVGSNLGLYTYWLARRAREVHAFEPNPRLAEYLAKAKVRGVVVHSAAASDSEGLARLAIPEMDGEAHIVDKSIDADLGDTHEVRTMTIDSLGLSRVSFVKIDAEGHEAKVLDGCLETLHRNRPVVFIELEERHRPGAIETARTLFVDELGYRLSQFMWHGRFYPLTEFDPGIMQPSHHPNRSKPDYVSNFLFRPF